MACVFSTTFLFAVGGGICDVTCEHQKGGWRCVGQSYRGGQLDGGGIGGRRIWQARGWE